MTTDISREMLRLTGGAFAKVSITVDGGLRRFYAHAFLSRERAKADIVTAYEGRGAASVGLTEISEAIEERVRVPALVGSGPTAEAALADLAAKVRPDDLPMRRR